VGDIVISQFKFSVAVVSLFSGATLFANSTAFNGYVQTSGNNGIDFNNLSGSNYKVTVTTTGQLNYRYQIGDQVFDSNPEASVLDLTGGRDTSWRDNGSRIGMTPAPSLVDTPAPAWSGPISTNYQLMISDDTRRPLSAPAPVTRDSVLKQQNQDQNQSQNQGEDTGFHSDPVLLGSVSGSNFDVSTLTPVPLQVPVRSLVSVITDGGGYYGFTGPFLTPVEEVPEPGTFVLLFAGTVAIAAFVRLRHARSLSR
jgi:hypothetical protein